MGHVKAQVAIRARARSDRPRGTTVSHRCRASFHPYCSGTCQVGLSPVEQRLSAAAAAEFPLSLPARSRPTTVLDILCNSTQ